MDILLHLLVVTECQVKWSENADNKHEDGVKQVPNDQEFVLRVEDVPFSAELMLLNLRLLYQCFFQFYFLFLLELWQLAEGIIDLV